MASEQVQQIITQMGTAIGDNSGLGGTLKFDFGEPGSVLIDGKSTPNTVSDGEGKTADTQAARRGRHGPRDEARPGSGQSPRLI
jgi:hypothetical protein